MLSILLELLNRNSDITYNTKFDKKKFKNLYVQHNIKT